MSSINLTTISCFVSVETRKLNDIDVHSICGILWNAFEKAGLDDELDELPVPKRLPLHSEISCDATAWQLANRNGHRKMWEMTEMTMEIE